MLILTFVVLVLTYTYYVVYYKYYVGSDIYIMFFQGVLTVVDVYNDWAGPCMAMASFLKKIRLEVNSRSKKSTHPTDRSINDPSYSKEERAQK